MEQGDRLPYYAKTKEYGFKLYTGCFYGSQAVTYRAKNYVQCILYTIAPFK